MLEKEIHIATERLIIRHLKMSDLHNFHIYRSNPEVTKYQGFDVMSLKECEQFITQNALKTNGKAGEWVQFAIENKATHQLIGDCAIHLHLPNPQIAEIGITISHLEQKKGFAKEAMLGILAFLFEKNNIRRVQEIVDAENEASIQLLKSTGFRLEGHFIENIFFKGQWGSEFQFAMLQSEWMKNK